MKPISRQAAKGRTVVGLAVLAFTLLELFLATGPSSVVGPIADHSNCNQEPCSEEELRVMTGIFGGITGLIAAALLWRPLVAKLRGEELHEGEPLIKVKKRPEARADGTDVDDRLEALEELRRRDRITSTEYAQQRNRILREL